MKKVIAFDFDGTLADSFASLNECFKKVFADFNVNVSEVELHQSLGCNEEGICRKIFGVSKFEDAFQDYLKYYNQYHDQYISNIDPKLKDYLYSIKDKCHLILITGRHKLTSEISFEKFGIEDLFEKCYFGNSTAPNKVENFYLALKDFGVENKDLIYIGDSTRDVLFARTANIDIISANYYHTADPKMLEHLNQGNVCYTIDQLIEKINKVLE